MLVAVKGNRETKIDANEKDSYIKGGHKIIEIDDKGKQKVLHDPANEEKADEKLKAELKKVKAENAELKAKLEKVQVEEKKDK